MPTRLWPISRRPSAWRPCDSLPGKSPCRSLPGIPDGIVEIFPPAAASLPDRIETIDNLDAIDILRILIADLRLHAKPERCSVADRQLLAIHSVGQDGLRVQRIL